MRSLSALAALAALGCVTPPSVDLDATGSSDSGASTEVQAASSSGGGVESGNATSDEPDASSSEAESDASTGCGDACAADPSLLWLTVVDDLYGDGTCLAVIPDGEGGLVASLRGTGFETHGAVMAVDELGHRAAVGSDADGGTFSGLSLRGPGLFDWASSAGDVGIADLTLQNLEGGPLAYDVAEIRAMATDERRYVARVTPSLQCVVRAGSDASQDSVPFACGEPFFPEALHHDAMGNWYYFEPFAYRVLRLDAAGLSWGSLEGRWNRVGWDASVDVDGHAWFVGAIGSGPDATFGSFVARHDFALAEEPQWERTSDDDVVWTAVATTAEGAVVLGHEGFGERLRGVGLTLEGETTWTWEHEPEPRTWVDAMAIDDAGDVVACGFRYEGEQTPVGSDATYPMFLKLDL